MTNVLLSQTRGGLGDRRPQRKLPQPLSPNASPSSQGVEMQSYLRLRQICLVAPHLEASSALIGALLGVEECHRDSGVAKYGLENADRKSVV